MKHLWILPVLAVIAVGCAHPQPTPTTHQATITVTNAPCPAGTAPSTCGYVFSSLTVTGTSCPVPTGQYNQLNPTSPVGQPASGNASFTDSTSAGTTKCYTATTVEGASNSQPASPVGPAAIPSNPTAPSLGSPTVAEDTKPILPEPKAQPKQESGGVEVAVNSPTLRVQIR